jgi:hypothetical protein
MKTETELAREVKSAQKQFKTKDSRVEQIEDDIKLCAINLTDEEIRFLSQYQMSKMVKSKIKE